MCSPPAARWSTPKTREAYVTAFGEMRPRELTTLHCSALPFGEKEGFRPRNIACNIKK